jgi:hypothetical protein
MLLLRGIVTRLRPVNGTGFSAEVAWNNGLTYEVDVKKLKVV